MAKKKTTGRGALAKDPPKPVLRGEARKDAQAKAVIAGTKAPDIKKGQRQFDGPTRAENKAIYDQMGSDDKAKYNWLRANGKLKEANQLLQAKTGITPTGPGGRARTPEDRKFQPPPPAPPPGAPPEQPTEAAPPPPTQPATFADQPFGGQVDTVTDTSGNVINRMGEYAGAFDPTQMQQQYEMQFKQEMDRYRQNVMSQFERRNQRQFEQQRLATQQQIAERGLDPASPAAQELMRQQNEREDLARQEAMSAAEQGAYGIQQQAFGQAKELALTPGQIAGQFQDPFMARMGFENQAQLQRAEIEAQARQADLQRQFEAGQLDVRGQQELELLRRQNQQRRWEVRNQPRGGGGGGAPGLTPWERLEANSLMQGEQPQINPIAAGAQGFVQGATGQVTSNLNRR